MHKVCVTAISTLPAALLEKHSFNILNQKRLNSISDVTEPKTFFTSVESYPLTNVKIIHGFIVQYQPGFSMFVGKKCLQGLRNAGMLTDHSMVLWDEVMYTILAEFFKSE